MLLISMGSWGTFFVDLGLAYKTRRKVEVLGVPCEAHFLARRDSGLRPGGGRERDFRTFAYKTRVKTTPPKAGCPDPPPYHFSDSSLYNFSGIIVSTKVFKVNNLAKIIPQGP